MKPFIICELGSNPARYDWNFEPFCRNAKLAGADAVKVQVWKAEHFAHTIKAQMSDGTWHEIAVTKEIKQKRPLEFPRNRVLDFWRYAHANGLQVGASVFDAEAVELVARHCDFIKLAAREQDNVALTENAIDTAWVRHKPCYRSISRDENPPFTMMSHVTTLWTVQTYPLPFADALRFVFSKRNDFKNGFGYSSHTRSIWDCVLAAKLGASVIEKHFALSRSDVEGGHSLLPYDFKRMTDWIRRVAK